MVKCETIDVEVPAEAQIILECEIHPTERELEAPFGEYPGTYGPQRNNPVVYVKAIIMRKNALYQSRLGPMTTSSCRASRATA
jgi:2,5-furandicarboxylate decarboxylase 1